MFHKLKNGAIFIADSHFNSHREELHYFLQNLPNGITQIFFMGDIFDFLSSDVTYFKNKNKKLIQTINQIALQYEVFYFEGNHDFNLKELFSNITIFTRAQQPVIFENNFKKYLLSHGDLYMGNGYEIYTTLIRNRGVQKFLNKIDFKNCLTSKIDSWLISKTIYHEFKDFKEFALKRIAVLKKYDCDFIVEGHFHQGKSFENYINLPTFSNALYTLFEENQFKNIAL
jgi:UDP-2,3-diacylglucosamine hydrolase